MKLFIYHHLGLGDHLICHGIVRNKAAHYEHVRVVCKQHNAATVAWMFNDLPNVEVVAVANDDEAVARFRHHRGQGCAWPVLALGALSGDPSYSDTNYDQHFYRHADVDFDERWSGFKAGPSATQSPVPTAPYCLVHRDARMNITPFIRSKYPTVHIESGRPNLFDWWDVIHNASEIHCIPSSVYLLIDSIDPFPDIPLFLHKWCRGDVTYPTHRKPWIILDKNPESL